MSKNLHIKGFKYLGDAKPKHKKKYKKLSIVKKCISCKKRRVSKYHHYKCNTCWNNEDRKKYIK